MPSDYSAGPARTPGLAGFKLPDGDLGWMRLEVIDRNGDGMPDEVEAIGWAYNNARRIRQGRGHSFTIFIRRGSSRSSVL